MDSRQDLRPPRGKTSWWVRLQILCGLGCGALILVGGSLLMLLVACVTLFQARRFYAEVMARWMSRAALRLCGVRLREHRDFPFPAQQTVFISNHTSTADLFVLVGLGLPRTRYFMSGFLRRILPLGLIGYLIGTFWTALQKYPERRARIFQRAERVLRRTGDSVFLTPEGQQIGCFNKGAFHLATNLSAPIQPIYIRIPAEVDPGPWTSNKAIDVRPGVIDVFYKRPIDTADWTLEDLEANRDFVRDFYADWQQELENRDAVVEDEAENPQTRAQVV